MSTLNVDNISEYTSGNGVEIPGHILQVKTQFFDTQTSISSTTSFTDTGLTLAITPSATSSKILCCFYVTASAQDNSYVAFKMFRDSTEIGSSTQTGTGLECFTGSTFDDTGNTSYGVHTIPMVFLDSPSTTSATTYKVQWSGENSDTFYLNRNASSSYGGNEGMVSTLTLMEVAA